MNKTGPLMRGDGHDKGINRAVKKKTRSRKRLYKKQGFSLAWKRL